MNELCECPIAGICQRHGLVKSAREHQLCRGINCTLEQTAKYWTAWEHGRMGNPAVPEPKEIVAKAAGPGIRGLGDRVGNLIHRVTGIRQCGGCKDRAALLNHWFPANLPPIPPIAIDAPRRHIVCHIWPAKGLGAWQWHCDRLLANVPLFNGRRIIAIATSQDADDPQAVQEYLRDFTDEFIVVPNDAQRREVVSWVPMLERLQEFNTDQDLTFACHAKGVRHRISTEDAGSTLFKWASAMFETCLDWPAIKPLLETHATAGSFRRFGAHVAGNWGPWHYSGTFYWFRNRDAFARNWRYVPQTFFGTEAWPGFMFKAEEAACLIGDNVGDLYNLDYWNGQIEPQLAAWRAGRPS